MVGAYNKTIDMSNLLNLNCDTKKECKYKNAYYKKQKEFCFGLELCKGAMFSGKYGIPTIKAYKGRIPDKFITLPNINGIGGANVGVCCFCYDYQMKELLNNPSKYINKFKKYCCVAEPDLSINIGFPLALSISNIFHSRAVAYYLQKKGIAVIPTIKWGDAPTFDFCFDGYQQGGAVLVSTMGILRDERSQNFFKNGFYEMIKRIKPSVVCLYGDVNEWLKSIIPSSLNIRFYKNERFNIVRSYGK